MIQSKANSTEGQKWGFANSEMKQNVTSALMMSFSRWEALKGTPNTSHYKHSAPHLSLRQSQARVWALQSKSLPVLLLYQGFCICLCTLECISWLLGLGCSGVHSQAVKRKLACPGKVSRKTVGGFGNWFLSTPSLCRPAAQGITVALDQTS